MFLSVHLLMIPSNLFKKSLTIIYGILLKHTLALKFPFSLPQMVEFHSQISNLNAEFVLQNSYLAPLTLTLHFGPNTLTNSQLTNFLNHFLPVSSFVEVLVYK